MIYGVTTTSGTAVAASADRLILNRASTTLLREAPAKIVARLDTVGGVGTQVFTPVVYDALGVLVVKGDPVTVTNSVERWVEFPFARSAVIPAGGVFYYGLHSGAVGSATRYRTTPTVGTPRYLITDTYADGTPASISITGSTADSSFVMFVLTSAVEVRGTLDDADLSALPWPEAQRKMADGGPVSGLSARAVLGWHGTSFDPVVGAVGVVNRNGPLADLVGLRVRLTYRNRSVLVYLHDDGDTVEDLSVTRRAFMDLASPAADSLNVLLEVIR